MKYAHTNIISCNWKLLAEFYIQVFKCEIIPPFRNQEGEWLSKGTGVPDAKLQGVHLLLPGHGKSGPTLEIYQYHKIEQLDPAKPNQRGFSHLAFEVDNVEKVLLLMESLGGSRYGEITKRKIEGVGQIIFVYARDPERNLIELQNWDRE